MKLSRTQTAAVLAVLALVISTIFVLGFLFRPSWASIRSAARAREKRDVEHLEKIPKEGTEAREQMLICLGNQAKILSAATSYYAQKGNYPPSGTVDENHPLVKEGFLSDAPTCPTTGKRYVLTIHSEGIAPSTQCPSNVPYHDYR